MSTRLFVAEDRELIRAGLREFVQGTDLEIVAEAAIHDATDLLRAKLLKEDPAIQLLLLGIEPPGTTGLSLLVHLNSFPAKPPVLLYAAQRSAEIIASAIANGANGLLRHSASRDTFVQAVHDVVRGESLWSRDDLRRAGAANRSTSTGLDVQLTRRETEVITKMVEGLTNKEIAESLGISYETVKEHVQHVLRKVCVADRTQAAVWAVREGIA